MHLAIVGVARQGNVTDSELASSRFPVKRAPDDNAFTSHIAEDFVFPGLLAQQIERAQLSGTAERATRPHRTRSSSLNVFCGRRVIDSHP